MARQFLLAIAAVSTIVLVSFPARAVTPLQCEDRGATCLGGCRDVTGGAGDVKGRQNHCASRCVQRVTACYVIARRPYTAPRF